MKLLYLPLINSSNLRTCSTSRASVEIFHAFLNKYKNSTCYVVLPENIRGGDFYDHPNLEVIPTKIWRQRQQLEMRYLPPEISRFWDTGTDFLDIVVSDKLPSQSYLRGVLSGLVGSKGGETERLYVTMLQFILTKKIHGYVGEHILIAQAEGLMHSDLIINQCQSQIKRIVQQSLPYLSAPKLMAIKKNQFFQGMPIADLFTLDTTGIEKDTEEIIVNFAVGMSANYKSDEIFPIVDSVYKGGRKVKFQINTPSQILVREKQQRIPERYKHAVWTRDIPYKEWLGHLKKAHIFLYDDESGEVSQTVMTQCLLRQVGLYKEGRYWQDDYMFQGYPYTYKTVEEAQICLRYLVDNYFSKEVQEVIDKQISFIQETYYPQSNPDLIIDKMVDMMIAKKKRTIGSLAYNLVKELIDGETLVPWDKLVKEIKARTDSGLKINKDTARYGRSPGVWRDSLLLLGYSDMGAKSGGIFQKVGNSIEDLKESRML